ncbi:YgaP family membrane protein [Sulfurospirillum arcachonense]|uniref:YgaP family membrane protein n=1 Tax=Sulfurospirillum arcachonense TaxID=57666 RepID=UPI00046912AA|nr:DUF2892 domain-containing protein [Sulfurospirillum arcachonense]
MKCNVGGRDRINRLVTGTALIAYAVYANQPMAYAGIIPLITGIVGFCPLYPLFKYSSCK